MTINTIKFSQFAAGSLANANYSVGVTSLSGGTNYQMPSLNSWNTAGRPVSPITGTLGYNTDNSAYEYWNGAAWVGIAAGGSGAVGLGGAGQVAYYASSGTTVTGTNTIPNTVQTQGITNGTSATAGDVGELISSIVNDIPMTNNTNQNLTSISLTAGDWDVWGGAAFVDNGGGLFSSVSAGISSTSATFPAPQFLNAVVNSAEDISSFAGAVPTIPVNITTTTTYYLVGFVSIGTGTVNADAALYARRRR